MLRRRPSRDRFGVPSFGRRIPRFNFEMLKDDHAPRSVEVHSDERIDKAKQVQLVRAVGGSAPKLLHTRKVSE